MKVIDIAKQEVGYVGGAHCNNKYNTWYYGGTVNNDKLYWCVVFIAWCFEQAGIRNLLCNGVKTASCLYVMNWAKQHGQWVTEDFQEGDLLLFDWGGDGKPDHIGFFLEYGTPTIVHTIEGNTDNSVLERSRDIKNVLGAYRPKYPVEDTKPEVDYYADGKAWAIDNGIIQGYGNGDYGWKGPVTREQLAQILYRALGGK